MGEFCRHPEMLVFCFSCFILLLIYLFLVFFVVAYTTMRLSKSCTPASLLFRKYQLIVYVFFSYGCDAYIYFSPSEFVYDVVFLAVRLPFFLSSCEKITSLISTSPPFFFSFFLV